MIHLLNWHRIKSYQPNPARQGIVARLGIVACLATGRGLSVVDFGRNTAEPSSMSDNLDHEPNCLPKTKYALFPPTGIAKPEVL